MKILSSLSLALALLFAAQAPAMAATILDGQVFCESRNQLNDDSGCDLGSDDLGQNPTTTLTFLGGGQIHGWVQDSGGNNSLFADRATLVLMRDSLLTFEIFDTDRGFLGTASITGGTVNESGLFGDGADTVGDVFLLAGTYVFSFDAANPNESFSNTTEYKVTIAPIPLPASGLLILGGLGALGVLRRRKARA